MAIQFVSGDLFKNRFSVDALAHGCNCQGSMGAGIATSFKLRYPAMFEEYRRRCKSSPRQFNLGDAFLWMEEGKPAVFNLATQERYWHSRASYEAIETALQNMKRQADEKGFRSIGLPRIGTGYGGLSWLKVRKIIEKVFEEWSGTIFVYEAYIQET